MTDMEAFGKIDQAKQYKRTGDFSTALNILERTARTIEIQDNERHILGHIYKAQAKVYFIQGSDEECFTKCLEAAAIFAMYGDQAEAFNISGILGCLHPNFKHIRPTYSRSLQGIGQFTDSNTAIEMAQTGLAILQSHFS